MFSVVAHVALSVLPTSERALVRASSPPFGGADGQGVHLLTGGLLVDDVVVAGARNECGRCYEQGGQGAYVCDNLLHSRVLLTPFIFLRSTIAVARGIYTCLQQVRLLLQFDDPHRGLLVSLLLHCLLSFIGRYAQNYKKIISKNYKKAAHCYTLHSF